MKIYIVTDGCYSDYTIEKVFSNRAAFTIMFVVIAIIAVYMTYSIQECMVERIITFMLTTSLLGGFLGLLARFSFSTPTKYEAHYKITIDDSVSMNEFLENYEILDQEGKIYTVRERG